ncbi:MAG: nuclear transport factor 2 family protein [Opitutae bacterium]|nr:nuclear transport factor 2 family protein [Opitutae bacterium]
MNLTLRPLVLALLAAGALPAQDVLPPTPRGPATHVLLAPLEADRDVAAVRAADEERLAAMMAADAARLGTVFSDELHYAHSNGQIDSKASLIKSLTGRSMVYESFDYLERAFKVAGPETVLMTGRAVIHVRSGDKPAVLDLNFLAVWRKENGRWRFLAWQSCRNPSPAPR